MADEPRGLDTLVERWTFANDASRLAMSAAFSQDIGKLAFQQDSGQYWRLISVKPMIWQQIGPTLVSSGLPSPEIVFADEDGDLVYPG